MYVLYENKLKYFERKTFNFVFHMYKQKFVTVLIRPVIETGTTKEVKISSPQLPYKCHPGEKKKLFEEKIEGYTNVLSVK